MVTFFHSSQTKFGQSSTDSIRLQGPSKEQALTSCIQSLLSKNAIERVENLNLSGFTVASFLFPSLTKVEASNRPKQAQHLPTCRKVQVETLESIRASLIPGEWVSSIDLSDANLHIPILPNSRKYLRFCHRSQVFQIHLPPLRAGHGPSGVYNDCKRSEADSPDKGNQTSPVPGRLADRAQSQEEAQTNTHTVVDLTQSLGWIINQEKSKLKPTQVFSFVGYEYHLNSALVKPSQERWLKLQDCSYDSSKTCFSYKMFDVANWVACLNGENGPGGTPSHEALSVSPQGALEIPSVIGQPPSLDRNHFSTPRMVAESHKRDERHRPSSQRPQYPTLYRCLKRRLGHSLRANFFKGSVVRPGKTATHKCYRAEGGFSCPSKVQGPVSNSQVLVATDNSTVVNKQGGTHLAETCALLWKIITWCYHYQITLKARHIQGV